MSEGWDRTISSGITAVSILAGVFITQFYEFRKRALEEKKWYAEFFLGRKIDALNNLYAALVDWHYTMNSYGNVPPPTMQEFKEKVQPKERAYLRAYAMASIYLDDSADNIMKDVLGAFRQANEAIWLNVPDNPQKDRYDERRRELDWAHFRKTNEEAVACLKNMLSPQVLEQFENTKKR
jgi:hypothetical protein